VNLITREELRAKLDRGERFKLVMTLSAHAYGAKHIPTSLYFDTINEALAALDPEEEIVVYCADVPCPASIRAYYLLQHAGYTRVRRYPGGIADWEDAGYPLEHGPRDPSPDKRPTKPAPQPRSRTRRERASLNQLRNACAQ
jgi:3-mercaptopyruvate sulfurtransferase SseA